MSPWRGMLIGAVSSLFTLLVIFALVTASGTALANDSQPPKPAEDKRNLSTPTPEPSTQPDENSGGPALPFVPEQGAPEAVNGWIHIPGSVFVPMHSDSGVDYLPWGCTYMTGPSGGSNYAVVLPPGATVTYLRLYYEDWSATYNGIMQFAEYNDGQNGSYKATLQTAGSSGSGTTTLSGLSIPVDYVNFSYVLYWDVNAGAGAQVQLCGMRIGYTAPWSVNFLPNVSR